MMNANVQVGIAVKAYKGDCIGLLIQSTTWLGEIVRVNKKSIRVCLTESTSEFGSKVTNHRENFKEERTYSFVKALSDGRSLYRSEAGLYGSITI